MKNTMSISQGWRRGRGVGSSRHDAYKLPAKLPEPTACPTCGAVWHKGRWTWGEKPEGAHAHVCPACQRIRDRYPAGELRLEGEFGERKTEILQLVHNQEAAEKADHPLERLMEIRVEQSAISITTTGNHLARRIGEALRRTWHEHVEIRYAKEDNLVRVTWRHPARDPAATPVPGSKHSQHEASES
jgi:hypothetical protein